MSYRAENIMYNCIAIFYYILIALCSTELTPKLWLKMQEDPIFSTLAILAMVLMSYPFAYLFAVWLVLIIKVIGSKLADIFYL